MWSFVSWSVLLLWNSDLGCFALLVAMKRKRRKNAAGAPFDIHRDHLWSFSGPVKKGFTLCESGGCYPDLFRMIRHQKHKPFNISFHNEKHNKKQLRSPSSSRSKIALVSSSPSPSNLSSKRWKAQMAVIDTHLINVSWYWILLPLGICHDQYFAHFIECFALQTGTKQLKALATNSWLKFFLSSLSMCP